MPSITFLASLVAVSNALTINAPAAVPDHASPEVDKQYLGMHMEGTSVPAYTGNKTHPNEFSLNLFGALTDRLGGLPIRIGGDTRDVGLYNPDQKEAVTFPQGTKQGLASHNTLGASYLEGLALVPKASWILGVPFALNNLTNTILFLRDSLKILPPNSLEAIEIGNEVTQYPGWYRPKDYSPADYASEWIAWADAITGNFTQIPKKSFWALSDADVASAQKTWAPENVFKSSSFPQHLDFLKAVSMHSYQVSTGTTLQADLLNHNKTTGSIARKFGPSINFCRTANPAIPFLLGEVGAGGGGKGEDPTANMWRNSLGSAVWYVDFLLASMVAGVQRVNTIGGHDGAESYGPGSLWLPATAEAGGTAPHRSVDTGFYAHILVADIFAAVKGALRVAPLDVSDDNPHISGYAAYDSGKLNRIIVLNERVWNSTMAPERPTEDVTISGISGKSAKLELLTGADSFVQEVSWAGQRWTVESNGKAVDAVKTTRTVDVKDGKIQFQINATEVVVVSFQ